MILDSFSKCYVWKQPYMGESMAKYIAHDLDSFFQMQHLKTTEWKHGKVNSSWSLTNFSNDIFESNYIAYILSNKRGRPLLWKCVWLGVLLIRKLISLIPFFWAPTILESSRYIRVECFHRGFCTRLEVISTHWQLHVLSNMHQIVF
jgi:hypothetical protein